MSDIRLDDTLLVSELKRKTGYNITHIKGQRIAGPPPFWTGPPPPRGCEICIRDLPIYVFEDELFPLFQTAGVIYEFRMMLNFSNINKDFAFVTYATKEEARRAVLKFHNHEIRPGCRIGVYKSFEKRRLVIYGFPASKSDAEILAELAKYTSDVPEIESRNVKYIQIKCGSHRDACMIRKAFMCFPPGRLFNCEIDVDWVPVNVLFVRNIPDYISESCVTTLFSFDGRLDVRRVKKLRDFAFVHYYTREDAELALSKLRGYRHRDWSIEVSWARSLPPYAYPKSETVNKAMQSSSSVASQFPSHQKQKKNLLQNNPVEILSYLCYINGWGNPTYDVTCTDYFDNLKKTCFTAKVTIPNLPYPLKCITSSQAFCSPGQAKNNIADYVLKNIVCQLNDQVAPRPVLGSSKRLNMLPAFSTQFAGSCVHNMSPMARIWNTPDVQSSIHNDLLDQDNFSSFVALAVSLANMRLKTKEEM